MSEKRGITAAARRSLVWLIVVIAAIPALIGANMLAGDKNTTFSPKLALDLEGGTQIMLTPVVTAGVDVKPEQLTQAVDIIRQRVDSTGASESQVYTSGNNIIVAIPGVPDDSTLALIKSSAKLDFRAVLVASAGTATAASKIGSAPKIATSSATPANPSDLNWVSKDLQKKYLALDRLEKLMRRMIYVQLYYNREVPGDQKGAAQVAAKSRMESLLKDIDTEPLE